MNVEDVQVCPVISVLWCECELEILGQIEEVEEENIVESSDHVGVGCRRRSKVVGFQIVGDSEVKGCSRVMV